MAFWGVEVKPAKPFTHSLDNEHRRLHISQATLGIGSATERSVLQCIVGNKSPVLLCSLLPEKIESCPLDLEFEEEDDVIFSVLGPRSVHLTGFYLGGGHSCGDGDESDSYGEDIADTDTDQSDFDDTDEEYDEDFIDDDDEEAIDMFNRPRSGVVIEEIVDDEKPANGKAKSKRLKKKYQMSDSDSDEQKQIVVKGGTNFRVIESEDEDEDGLPKSKVAAKSNGTEEKSDKKKVKERKKEENGVHKAGAEGKSEMIETKKKEKDATGLKRKIDDIVQDGTDKRTSEKLEIPSEPSTDTGAKKNEKPKKKNKARAEGDGSKVVVPEVGEPQSVEAKTNNLAQEPVEDEPIETIMDIDGGEVTDKDQSEEKKKKRKKKKKNKAQETDTDKKTGDEGKKVSAVKAEIEKAEEKPSRIRTFPNGLVIEEVKLGKPDGKKATGGKRVSVRYIGKLKSNGKIFDSNVNKPPFKFCLGIGEVIKGWDIGVDGMRVGDKRRLTIPPSMGYGSKGALPAIPPNASLMFDIELLDVR